MGNLLKPIVVVLLFFSVVTPALSLDVSGNWEMKSASKFTAAFKQDGEFVKGTYVFGKGNKGQIVGIMYDGLLEGYWFQDTASRKCKTAKNGTYHWGRLMLQFTETAVQGKDSFCDAAPVDPWTGTKLP